MPDYCSYNLLLSLYAVIAVYITAKENALLVFLVFVSRKRGISASCFDGRNGGYFHGKTDSWGVRRPNALGVCLFLTESRVRENARYSIGDRRARTTVAVFNDDSEWNFVGKMAKNTPTRPALHRHVTLAFHVTPNFLSSFIFLHY